MDQILNELKSVPGVIGAFVFHTQTGVKSKALPEIFRETKLVKMGKSLVKIYAAGCMGVSELSELSLFYEESIVIVRRISTREFLIVLLDPSANLNLVTMSLALTVDELKTAPEKQPAIMVSAPVNKEGPALPAGGDNGFRAEEMLNRGPMADSLRSMQLSLAKVMGPIAKVIFRDALNEWGKSGQPSFATIAVLIDILQKEINDPEKFQDYRQRIAAYLVSQN